MAVPYAAASYVHSICTLYSWRDSVRAAVVLRVALVKRANGKWTAGSPAALSPDVLFMSGGGGGGRRTPWRRDILPLATPSSDPLPNPLEPPGTFFTFCATALPSCQAREVIIGIDDTLLKCNPTQCPARSPHRCCVEVIIADGNYVSESNEQT